MALLDDFARSPLNYKNPNLRAPRSISRVWLFGAIAVLFLIIFIFLYGISRAITGVNRGDCNNNLRWIGQAIRMYADDNQGAYPDSVATILMNEDINSGAFVCPNTNDAAAIGPTKQAIAANMMAGGHYSYVYLGRGWTTTTTPPNAVVIYEPLANHGGEGMNVLFGDGHADWVPARQAKFILANAGVGKPPVTMPTGQ